MRGYWRFRREAVSVIDTGPPDVADSTRFAKTFEPDHKGFIAVLIDVQKLYAHAHFRFHHPHHAGHGYVLPFARKGKAYPRANFRQAARADKASNEGKIRSYSFHASTGF